MDVSEWSIWALLGLVAVMTAVRYLLERALSRLFKAAKIERTSPRIFVNCLVMVAFNILVLFLFGLLTVDLVAFANVGTGLIFLAIGLGVALLVSLLSYAAIVAGHGQGYETLLSASSADRVLTWTSLLVLVGPAEDLFFLGFAQNLLLERMGWGSIVVYVVLFVLYHYANVLSGVEKKKEFLGALPVRLMVAILLAVSFYMTRSLIYGLVIHNTVDTLSYVALMLGVRRVRQGKAAA